MPNIFSYINYREYLQDYYIEQKSKNSAFSFQFFANKAGFKSKSFLKLVIDGKKNLTDKSIIQMNRALKLGSKAFSYFKDLVAYNQARSIKLQNYYFSRIAGYNKRNRAKLILQEQYEFYSKWYYNTIRELICIADFKGDYDKLAAMVRPRISVRKVKQSVKLLLKYGLIKKTKQGFRQTDSIITTGDEVKSLAVQNFHLQNLVLAGESIDTCPTNQRDISCLILGLSKKSFQAIKSEIQQFRKKLLKIADNEKEPKRVYHVGFQLFPTSEEQ
jgi:uncharacterized protein (TIGR02147 family)